ncbi:MAG: thioredoxin domain-containing protein, partial [Phyllobacterium sp.]|nr:thioredoxin domain-containing protein [Phyllobacterium sp.]
ELAENALGRVLEQRYGQAGVLNSASLLLEPMKLVLVTADKGHPLLQLANDYPDPRRTDIWMEFRENTTIELVPGGGAITIKKPAAYLCRGFVCLAPVETAEALAALLKPQS